MLDADKFYDSVDTLHKTVTIATDAKVPTYSNDNKAGHKGSSPRHSDPTAMVLPPPNLPSSRASNTSDSYDSESDPNGDDEESMDECRVQPQQPGREVPRV